MIPRRPLRTLLLLAAGAALVPAMIGLNRVARFPEWRMAVGWTPAALASSIAVPGAEIDSGLPVLSLVLDHADLYDPQRGLLASRHNVIQHGPEWERDASVSYFEGGRLRFATGVGVRIHGASSRIRSPRMGFRLYFRRRLGATQVPPGVLFEPDAQPIRRLVVHNDSRWGRGFFWHFVNPLAYDIAERVGAIAPDTKPVRFFVNGEYYGVFVLTERFDERFFEAHRGHGQIRLDQKRFNELWNWVRATRPLTPERVREHIDLDNLTRWFLAVAFCATRDAYQGPGQYEDLTRQAPWFWVNWDMDQSFREWDLDTFQLILERIAEEPRGRNRAEPRAIILTHLIAESPEYRREFMRIFQHAMNHQWTPAFLEERFQHYAQLAKDLGVENTAYLTPLRMFFDRRPAFFRRLTETWLNSEAGHAVSIDVPAGRWIVEGGARVEGRYAGTYYADLETDFEVPRAHRRDFRGWIVDGTMVSTEPVLRLKVSKPTQIVAAFEGQSPVAPLTPPVAQQRPSSTPAPDVAALTKVRDGLRWVRIPGPRPFEMLAREVTAAEFASYAAFSAVRMPRQPDWFANASHPVTNVTWDEARGFCAWADGRLPTQAEWLHAARGGAPETNQYPWGADFAGEANLQGMTGRDTFGFTAPAGSFLPNGYGLYDMIGNVWEWTADRFVERRWPHYERRTIRGGSWDSHPDRGRLSARAGLAGGSRHSQYVGFRCVR